VRGFDQQNIWCLLQSAGILGQSRVHEMPTSTVTVQSFKATDPSTTNATVVHYLLTFSAPVIGVDTGDFNLVTHGVTGASIVSVTPVSGSGGAQYNIAVNTGSNDGTLALHLSVTGIHNLAGNLLTGAPLQPAVSYATGTAPQSVAIGDVNGDGKPDLVVANFGSTPFTVGVLLGNRDGTFQPQLTYPTGHNPISVAIGDLNGDSKPDLVIADDETPGAVSVLLGNGNGTFQPQASYPTGPGPTSVAIGDFNRDGRPDIVVTNGSFESNSVSVLVGNGDGTFGPHVMYAAGVAPSSVAVGDLNGDGKLDIVTTNFGGFNTSNNVSVLLGNGDGSFQPQTKYAVTGTPLSVAIGDLNGDGRLDLAVASNDTNTVSVLLGKGDGTFQPETTHAASVGPSGIAIADFDGDGKPDLVSANFGSNTARASLSLLLGNGDGTVQAQTNYPTGTASNHVAVADLNGDSRPDAVTSNQGSDNVSVLLNNSPTLLGPTYTIDKPVPADHAPVAANGGASGEENAVIIGALLATDADGDRLTFSRLAQASHGSVSVNANGSFVYTPNTGFSGTDSFTFKANDGVLDSNIATVSLTIFDAATPPHLASGPASGASPAAAGSVASLPGDPFHDAAGAAPMGGESTFPATLARFTTADFHLL
jgi:VCBS repeat-containing protein